MEPKMLPIASSSPTISIPSPNESVISLGESLYMDAVSDEFDATQDPPTQVPIYLSNPAPSTSPIPSTTSPTESLLSISPHIPLPVKQGDAIITIKDEETPSYNEKSLSPFEKSDRKLLNSRTFSIPIGPPPSYDSFSSALGSKLRLRPLKSSKTNIKETAWGIHWYMPTCMVVGLVAGIMTAVGHHLYNSRLDGNEVGDPTWPQRFGSAFSFFVKFCLVGAVEIAYKQRAWMTVKRRDLKVKTLDGVFSACNDPFQFLNPELILKATVPALIAALFWLLPLCAVASPASLSSIASIRNSSATCNNIQSIDLNLENGFAKESIGNSQPAMSFYEFQNGSDSSLIYDEPSTELSRVTTLALLSRNGPLPVTNPCEGGLNCSYSFSFYGPAYSCNEVANFDNEIGTMSIDKMVPNLNQSNIYFGESDEYENSETGSPTPSNPPSPTIPWDGVFTKEASMYIGWTENTTQPLPPDPDSPWAFLLVPHVMQCIMYNASYDYTLSFLNGLMNIDRQNVDLIAPLLLENSTTIVGPDDPNYGVFSAYHSLGWIYRNQLSNSIDQYNDKDPITGVPMSSSDVSQTTLVDRITQFAVPNFPQAVESLFHNTTFSILSLTTLHSATILSLPCTTTTNLLIWRYSPFWLVLSYSVAILTTIIAALIGAHAFRSNGYSIDTNFSTFLVTTRNTGLDEVVRRAGGGTCLGMEPLKKGVLDGRLRFGDVGGGEGERHAAFGVQGTVKGVVFGESYV